MNPIPWYKSPVYIGAIVTILSSLAGLAPKTFQLLGLTDPTAIETIVGAVFQVIALVAGVITAEARRRSTIQPIALTQATADAAVTTASQKATMVQEKQDAKNETR